MRQGRSGRSFRHGLATGLRRDPVLIACEGKTEEIYIKALLRHLGIRGERVHFADVKQDSSPKNLYRRAQRRYNDERKLLGNYKDSPYQRVFCVFDRNAHESFHWAMGEIETAEPADVFKAIPSVPCFEYWLMLHFEYTTCPYEGPDACRLFIKNELRRHMENYKKGEARHFPELMQRLSQALERSAQSLEYSRSNNTDSPYTLMHELVEELRQLAE